MKITIGIGILLLIIILCVILGQRLLRVRNQVIHKQELPASWDGMRILQISDIHHRQLGKNNSRLIRAAARTQPDWIVITGDLVSRDFSAEKELAQIWTLLTSLRKIAPVYLCLGNHELDLIRTDKFQPLATAIEKTGCRLLNNERLYFQRDGEEICLAGASLKYQVYRNELQGYRHLKDYTTAQLKEDLGKKDCFTLLLAHNPLMLKTYGDWGADVVLCGHMHGGVVRLPCLGGLLSPERRFFPKYDKGLYQYRNTYMYVSSGIGKFRLFNLPEINLIELRKR